MKNRAALLPLLALILISLSFTGCRAIYDWLKYEKLQVSGELIAYVEKPWEYFFGLDMDPFGNAYIELRIDSPIEFSGKILKLGVDSAKDIEGYGIDADKIVGTKVSFPLERFYVEDFLVPLDFIDAEDFKERP